MVIENLHENLDIQKYQGTTDTFFGLLLALINFG
jgi:hypothetical protein